jgi:hypothetical protein
MKVKIFASRILFILLPPNGYPFNQQGFGSPNIIGAFGTSLPSRKNLYPINLSPFQSLLKSSDDGSTWTVVNSRHT